MGETANAVHVRANQHRSDIAVGTKQLQKLRSQVLKADHNRESKEERSLNKIGKIELLDPETRTRYEHFTLS